MLIHSAKNVSLAAKGFMETQVTNFCYQKHEQKSPIRPFLSVTQNFGSINLVDKVDWPP